MPIDSKLLDILRCPLTKQSLRLLSNQQIDQINAKISEGTVRQSNGSIVDSALEAGLITQNGNLIYRIDSDIPVMLQDLSISMTEINDN